MTTVDSLHFCGAFKKLTGNDPFPWQQSLYEHWFAKGVIPRACNLPTGLGKTSILAIWLIALANCVNVPRRLVYVVNRRTVVDQTTNEAEKLCRTASEIGITNLAISTLRGEHADNREWSIDPSRPAIVCGTVDMIGSRLLFSGYGVGFKSRPLHAGFLGQDTLVVHDEAHLEPAFQTLLETIQAEQCRCKDFRPIQVMQLTATKRSSDDALKMFGLTEEELNPPEMLPEPPTQPIHHVWRRSRAFKQLALHSEEEEKNIPLRIAAIAREYKDREVTVVVFARTLEAVTTIRTELQKSKCETLMLTGTLRGKERDELAKSPLFGRFQKDAPRGRTLFLVCTSAGEVGIDISADHMVCDLSTFESMAQRLGRVNRYGNRSDSRIDVVHPNTFGKKDNKTGELIADEIEKRRSATLELLRKLPELGECFYDASPRALATLKGEDRIAAFSPSPTILPATDILFDAWALTSIRHPMPGRPYVEPYLHGVAEWQPPETYVAWRSEVEFVTGDLLKLHPASDLLDDYPLRPHELLRDATDRKGSGVFAQIKKMAERQPKAVVWLVGADGDVKARSLREIVQRDGKQLYGVTLVLPPSLGGLNEHGMLDGGSHYVSGRLYDVADVLSSTSAGRIRLWSDTPGALAKASGMRRVRRIEMDSLDDGEPTRAWEWYETLPLEGGKAARKAVIWSVHVDDVKRKTAAMAQALGLPPHITNALLFSAGFHDHGKRRQRFQLTLGNRRFPDLLLAKSAGKGLMLAETFRHEFASLFDAQGDPAFLDLDKESQDLALHTIAAHHGRARPHFDADEAYDPDRRSEEAFALSLEIPRRFARLQRRFGRWGLAYLESVLRAADWAASDKPSAYADEQ